MTERKSRRRSEPMVRLPRRPNRSALRHRFAINIIA
jgi:hypothetical protein